MWFLMGMMLGSSLSGEEPSARMMSALTSEVPFRCFVALDDGDQAYRECRRLSMTVQLSQQIMNTNDEVTGFKRGTLRLVVDDAISLELRGLRALEKSAPAKQGGG